MKSRNGKNIFAFRGIKYAEPPTGNNRFNPPIPIRSRQRIIDATKDGWMCPQPEIVLDKSLMNEDCLILNVYSNNLSDNKPVLAYIYGGGFIFGGSHSKYTSGPQYFLDKDIVLVTINYRLGPFGFLSTANEDAPGNIGFKDQVLALKWIQQNIGNFGGNPNSVTILDESAGSMSVNLHLISPMSSALFHGAIMMSGGMTGQYTAESQIWTMKLGQLLNCQVNDTKILLNCLQNIPMEDILIADNELLLEQPFLPWTYQIENDYGQKRFLTDHPTKLLAQGKINKVPLIIGTTKDEFASLAAVLGTEMLEDFNNVAPKYLMYGSKIENSTKITELLKNFYLRENSSKNIEKLFTDAIIGFSIHRLANLAKFFTNVYYYRFDFRGRYSHVYDSIGNPAGVFHADDLQYIFVYDGIAPMFNKTDRENIMVERLTHWFATFAATGDPNSNPNEWTSGIHWPVSNATKLQTLYINEQCLIGDEPYQDRFKLWDELFPIPT